MITERTNPRMTQAIWLGQIWRGAIAERAHSTADHIIDLSQAQIAMTADCDEADPVKMRKLVKAATFPRRARRYLERNWVLNTGLSRDRDQVSIALASKRTEKAIDQALEGLRLSATKLTEASGPEFVRITDRVAEALSGETNTLRDLHGEGTGVLLREILGLPGDAAHCEKLTNPEVLECALLALERFGVTVAPELYESLQVNLDDESLPEPA